MSIHETESAFPIPAGDLIPHRPPMRLIDALTDFREQAGTLKAVVRSDSPLTRKDGTLEEVGLVEMLAQAYAALKGYEDRLGGEAVKRGFLVGVRALSTTGIARVGDHLEIHLKTVAVLDGFAVAEGKVLRGDDVLARGTLKLWVSSEIVEEDACAI
jgi:3-hydroxyacyl-[acyl-carrier-protein] dehydratase